MARVIDYYSLLGIPRSSDTATIKRIIRQKLREFHPDHTHHLSPELREYARRRFDLVMEARAVLTDPDARAGYDHTLDSAMNVHVCPKCGDANYLPTEPRRGPFVCRSCGSELLVLQELPLDEERLSSLLLSAFLAVRNIGLQRLSALQVELVRGEYGISVSYSTGRDILQVIPSHRELVSTDLRLVGIRRGRDRRAAREMIQRLMPENGPWLIRIIPLSNRWGRWASAFIVSSLFSLTPGESRRILESFSWNLAEVLRRYPLRSDYIERLKDNWRAMAEPSVLRH